MSGRDLVGELLDGRYRILERIGEGGMADVYLAEQLAVRRPVALKVLRPRFEVTPDLPRRFQREAEAASRLSHPNIVTIHDFGEAEGELYIAMEYIRGGTIARLHGGRPLDVERACTLVSQVCAALQDAHDNGVVHNDLKPENILVSGEPPAERVTVLDFGISRILIDPHASAEHAAELRFGTPLVVAPEILLGAAAGPPSDVYSLGIVFYEMLSGAPPFDTRDVKRLLADHVQAAPPPLAESLDVPSPVAEVLLEMLAKRPGQRPRTMREIAERIAPWTRAPDWPSRSTAPPLASGPARSTAPGRDTQPQVEWPTALRTVLGRSGEGLGFPAFAAHVAQINALCDDDDVPIGALAAAVLQDFGVCDKLLRLVNASFYRSTREPVASISRAIRILGTEQVRRAALSLGFWEHLRRGSERAELLDAAMTSLASALVARDLAADLAGVDAEEAFLCGMFRQMGRHVVMHHLPTEYAKVQGVMRARGVPEFEAARDVLGLTFERLGEQVAEHLGFPSTVVASMRPANATPDGSPAGRLQALSVLSNALVDECAGDPRRRPPIVAALVTRYGAALGIDAARAHAALDTASGELARRAEDLGLSRSDSRVLRGLATRPPSPAPSPMAEEGGALASLARALPEVRAAVDRGDPFEEVTAMVLEAMYRGASFGRVLFCLRSFRTGRMTGRLGFGHEAGAAIGAIDFSVEGPDDLFRDALRRGEMVTIPDARLPSVRARLPAWYLEQIGASAMALFPVVVQGKSIALVYADSARQQNHPDWIDAGRRAQFAGLVEALQDGFRRVGRR